MSADKKLNRPDLGLTFGMLRVKRSAEIPVLTGAKTRNQSKIMDTTMTDEFSEQDNRNLGFTVQEYVYSLRKKLDDVQSGGTGRSDAISDIMPVVPFQTIAKNDDRLPLSTLSEALPRSAYDYLNPLTEDPHEIIALANQRGHNAVAQHLSAHIPDLLLAAARLATATSSQLKLHIARGLLDVLAAVPEAPEPITRMYQMLQAQTAKPA